MASIQDDISSILSSKEFSELPSPAERSDYEDVKEELLERWKDLPSPPCSIYQIGQVSVPGLSDLDFIMIFDREQTVDWSLLDPNRYRPRVRSIYAHPPICCTRRSWKAINAVYPIFDISHLQGEVMPENAIPDEMVKGCSLSLLLNMLITKIPTDIIKLLCTNQNVRIKTLLATNKSLKYTLGLAERSGIFVSSEEWAIAHDADKLREEWFHLSKKTKVEELVRVTTDVIDVAGSMMEKASTLIEDEIAECEVKVRNECFLNFSPEFQYSSQVKNALVESKSRCNEGISKPSNFLSLLSLYSEGSSRFGDYLESKNCIVGIDPSVDKSIYEGGKYHAESVGTYIQEAAHIGVYPEKYVGLGYSETGTYVKARRYITELMRGNIEFGEIVSRVIGKFK